MARQWVSVDEVLEEESQRQTDEEAERYGGSFKDLLEGLPNDYRDIPRSNGKKE